MAGERLADRHAGISQHGEAMAAVANVADAQLALIDMSAPEGAGLLTPTGSRAQRYNAKLRERMDARDAGRKPTPREGEP